MKTCSDISNDLEIKERDSADGNEVVEMFTAAYKHTKKLYCSLQKQNKRNSHYVKVK